MTTRPFLWSQAGVKGQSSGTPCSFLVFLDCSWDEHGPSLMGMFIFMTSAPRGEATLFSGMQEMIFFFSLGFPTDKLWWNSTNDMTEWCLVGISWTDGFYFYFISWDARVFEGNLRFKTKESIGANSSWPVWQCKKKAIQNLKHTIHHLNTFFWSGHMYLQVPYYNF